MDSFKKIKIISVNFSFLLLSRALSFHRHIYSQICVYWYNGNIPRMLTLAIHKPIPNKRELNSISILYYSIFGKVIADVRFVKKTE